MSNREGTHVPSVTFRTRQHGEWVDVTSDELFKGRTVVVFALPGAYTPTCSASHLPRYEELAPQFFANGVDEIVCLTVNDPFVCAAWAVDQNADQVRVIPDGNGEFTEKMGMLVDKSDLGFGPRSWRYSMLVRDGVIDRQFIEPEKPGDPYEVSDADTMLHYINPEAREPEVATVFTRPGCAYCDRALNLLDRHGIRYEEIVISRPLSNYTLRAVSGATTTPQVFIGGQLVGGSEDLEAYLGKAA